MKFLILLFLHILFLDRSTATTHRKHNRRSFDDERWLNFKFTAEPEESLFSSKALLSCSYEFEKRDGRVTDEVEWQKDGEKLENPPLLANGSLWIEKLSEDDSGEYSCAVKITGVHKNEWTFRSKSVKVQARRPLRFKAEPEDVLVAPGHSAVFKCVVDSIGPTIIRWLFNDRPLRENDDIRILPVSNSLEITPVLPKHQGFYRCEVTSHGVISIRSTSARLQVDATTPSLKGFLSSPSDQRVIDGDQAILECLPGGQKPSAHVEWLRDGSVLVEDGQRVKRISGSLHFTKTRLSDEASYTCRANLNSQIYEKMAQLSVIEPPRLVRSLSDKIALETTDVELICEFRGNPTPKIRWLKNGVPVKASEYFLIDENRLQVLGVVKMDQGVYQCIGENEAGSVQSIAQLLVDSADSSSIAASSGKPMLSTPPLALKTTLIGARSLGVEWDAPMEAHGNILIYHVFYREEGSTRERAMNASSRWVNLGSLQPETLYIIRVAAENEAGVGQSSDHIKVTTSKEQAVPGRISRLGAQATDSEKIEVRWEPPTTESGGPTPLRYRLFYIRHPPQHNERETQITVSSTEYTLHGMDKYTEYAIRVEAEGANGAGLSSDTITVRTLSDVPSSAPEEISVDAQSSTSIRISWKPPPKQNQHGELTAYRIKYKTKQRGGKTSTVNIEDPLTGEHVIDGLDPNQHYQLRIAAANQNGTGPFSDWLRADTPAVDKEEKLLGAPVELKPIAGPDYILVTWKPPSDETTIVRGYTIGWGHNVPDVESTSVGANALQYRIENLNPGREYVISVRAKNKYGQGYPIYETVRTGTERGRNAFGMEMDSGDGTAVTPIAVRAEALSASSMKITWSDPDEEAFNVKYTVKYSTGAEGNKLHYAESSEPFAVVESLRPATEYEFAVRASHGGAHSLWSMATRNKTLSSPPSSAPRDLSLSPSPSGDPHHVLLHWQPPKYSNGELIEYLIYYSDRSGLDDKDWRLASVPADRMSHSIHDLLPKSIYYFKIQARNIMGYGPLSPIVTWRGLGGVQTPPNSRVTIIDQESASFEKLAQMLLAHPIHLSVAAILLLLVVIAVIVCAICMIKKSTKRKPSNGKRGQSGDLWINHSHGSHMRPATTMELLGEPLTELKPSLRTHGAVDSPPPRYHALQTAHEMEIDRGYGTVSSAVSRPNRPRAPLRGSISGGNDGGMGKALLIGRAHPIQPLNFTNQYAQSEDNESGTLSRSYHHSSSSLEQRTPRTPQVLYTGTGKHQPIAKIELDSPYGSSSQLTPTPPLQAPPNNPPITSDGYRTLRGQATTASGNPLRSFTSVCQPPQQPRPVIIAAGGRQVPVGRAQAQPRVNMANIYSPYASCSQLPDDEKHLAKPESSESDERTPLHGSGSNEELNEITENIDALMQDLQGIHNHYGIPSNPHPNRPGTAWSND
ncbi:unnamed protein product, partial [Mesorhabditis belari]|uniref:Uncharacterized protein n=1 Tax=Mesorhabditis belari TaxID=2138241 RepID=A0AAF3FEE8_9BILA